MTSAGLATYAYDALATDGRSARGTVAASSDADARARLKAQGLLPIAVRVRRDLLRRSRPRLKAAELAVGLRILADLLGAGLPMARALELFEQVAPDAWRSAIGPIRASVREGRSLATAMAEAPVVIPSLVIGMARAGEAGDGIADAMRRAAAHAEAAAASSAAIKAALAYPIVVATTGALSLGVMVGVVLPKFALILADLGQALPPMTRTVLGAAAVLKVLALPVAVAGVIAIGAYGRWVASENGRRSAHAIMLRLPLAGRLRHAASTTRLTAAMAALVGSGVAIPVALRLASEAGGDAEGSERTRRALERIRAGESLAMALGAEAVVTPVAVRLVRAGEESGRLVPMLEHVSQMERERVARAVTAGVRALEPLLILLFAGLVGLVAMALLQAVYAVRPT